MASAQVIETSVTNNSPSQDSNHPDDLFQSRNITFIDIASISLAFLGDLIKISFQIEENINQTEPQQIESNACF